MPSPPASTTALEPTNAPESLAADARSIPAWLMSASVHAVLIIVLAIFVRAAPRGANVEPNRSGGIVLVRNNAGAVNYLSENEFEGDSSKSNASAAAAQASGQSSPLPSVNEMPVDLAGALPAAASVTGISSDLSGVLPNASGLTDGFGPSKRGGGGQTTTQVFGVQGTGSKFVYVFDRSGSMSTERGRPLAASKSQLMASLKSLKSTDQFQIIFYNERTFIFNPFPGREATLMFGTDENKRLAADFVARIPAGGGTRHLPALRMALAMTPDVVFFLTDAEEPRLTSTELSLIDRLNKITSINCIEFGTRAFAGNRNFLTELAERNRGHYAYRNVRELRFDDE